MALQERRVDRPGLFLQHAPLMASLILLVAASALVVRTNINWDEFYFLSKIHLLARDELSSAFQTPYTRLFYWLPMIGGEMEQVRLGRALMVGLLGMTAWLIWKLASRWVDRSMAWISPLAYLSSFHVLAHGGSFRADSLLAPLTVATLVLITSDRDRNWLWAGLCMGLSIAVSVKAVLLLPAVALMMYAQRRENAREPLPRFLATLSKKIVNFGAIACGTALLLLLLHASSLSPHAAGAAAVAAASAGSKTLLQMPLLPRDEYLYQTLLNDRLTWLLICIGAVFAWLRRMPGALACILSLLPILFYRNSFPYYYVVMLAPASVLAALGVQALSIMTRKLAAPYVTRATVPLVATFLFGLAVPKLLDLAPDRQTRQQDVIDAVHQIFPDPVSYVDHSGMIASFPKSNFFMSTWGIEVYRASGTSFMRRAIDNDRVALLLANMSVLQPGSMKFEQLLFEDQQLLKKFYVPYWGPISVAGARAIVAPGKAALVDLPFSGRYRLISAHPVTIDGKQYREGDEVVAYGQRPSLNIETMDSASFSVSLVWAAANPPPPRPPPSSAIYVTFGH